MESQSTIVVYHSTVFGNSFVDCKIIVEKWCLQFYKKSYDNDDNNNELLQGSLQQNNMFI